MTAWTTDVNNQHRSLGFTMQPQMKKEEVHRGGTLHRDGSLFKTIRGTEELLVLTYC